MTATTLAEPVKLGREEAAHAHLNGFRPGDKVEVNGREARVYCTAACGYIRYQGRVIKDASAVLVESAGAKAYVSVRTLLRGEHTITSEADAKTGNVRCFGRTAYAEQNPEV